MISKKLYRNWNWLDFQHWNITGLLSACMCWWQIATVLACMSSVESCSRWLSSEPGVAELLVQYLHEKAHSRASAIERSACERLQQKSAVAITRLSDTHDVGLIFVELHCELPHVIGYCCKLGNDKTCRKDGTESWQATVFKILMYLDEAEAYVYLSLL